MKTIDEVIKALDFCKSGDLSKCKDCPYIGTCELDYAVLSDDALHYLKEHKNQQDFYSDGIKRTTEMIDKCEKTVAEYLAVNNPPLTWSELKQMEGKPVWVEAGKFGSHWYLIEEICQNETIVCLGKFHESITLYHEDILTYWQAYRKERK